MNVTLPGKGYIVYRRQAQVRENLFRRGKSTRQMCTSCAGVQALSYYKICLWTRKGTSNNGDQELHVTLFALFAGPVCSKCLPEALNY